MTAPKRPHYHHGDLRPALIAAAEALIRENGLEGFSLRGAAARAGVSVGACAHHFSGVSALLTEVAVRAFQVLGDTLRALPRAGTVAAELRSQAAGYVAFAANNPGLFRLICRVDLIDLKGDSLQAASFDALSPLMRAAAAYRAVDKPDRTRRKPNPAIVGVLATAHGLAHIVLEGRPALVFESPDPVGTFMTAMLPAILDAAWPDLP